ncbi:hypothetical protein N431DRAFT_314710, partial [Stipitochalara longipes BDJ]
TDVPFRNDGDAPLLTPGFNDLPIYLELPREERFAHGSGEWTQDHATARELAILRLINNLTDRLDWQSKVFDKEIVSAWREEALSIPLISTRAWEWCLAELRDKANIFEKTSRILVLNTGSGVCKSDTILSAKLRGELKENIALLMADSERRGVSRTDQQELALVDPSLFPLVYGRTQVLTDGGAVTLDKLVDSCGKGSIAPEHEEYEWDSDVVCEMESSLRSNGTPFWTFDRYSLCRFSTRFQWLPCEVKFTSQAGCDVRITSYINNLHPKRFKPLYHNIETLISLAIEPWNDILIKGDYGRWPKRIKASCVEWQPAREEWPSPETLQELEKDRTSVAFQSMVHQIREFLSLPEPYPEEQKLQQINWRPKPIPEDWEVRENGLQGAISAKWHKLYHWEHPDVGIEFSYDQWKAGQTGIATIKSTGQQVPDHEFYSVSLQETFRERGLQIIIKIGSIDLTPEKPAYTGGFWQLEATLNEHIVATAVFYYDEKNISNSRISFRQQTEWNNNDDLYTNSEFNALLKVFAIPEDGRQGPAYQDIDSVSSPKGRLLAWPNTLHHRVEPFELVDAMQPGYQRFITLYLVDPHYRICSTSNVPPQQHNWWVEEALTSTGFAEKGMPQEVLDLIERATGQWPMGEEEAKQLQE